MPGVIVRQGNAGPTLSSVGSGPSAVSDGGMGEAEQPCAAMMAPCVACELDRGWRTVAAGDEGPLRAEGHDEMGGRRPTTLCLLGWREGGDQFCVRTTTMWDCVRRCQTVRGARWASTGPQAGRVGRFLCIRAAASREFCPRTVEFAVAGVRPVARRWM